MNSKLTDSSRFASSVKALFKAVNFTPDGRIASGTKASRASERVFLLARKCSDPVLARKLYAVSDALHEHRHLLNATRVGFLPLQIQHSKRVGELLQAAGVV